MRSACEAPAKRSPMAVCRRVNRRAIAAGPPPRTFTPIAPMWSPPVRSRQCGCGTPRRAPSSPPCTPSSGPDGRAGPLGSCPHQTLRASGSCVAWRGLRAAPALRFPGPHTPTPPAGVRGTRRLAAAGPPRPRPTRKVPRRLCRCHPPPAGDVAVWRWRPGGRARPRAAAAGPGSQAQGRQAAPAGPGAVPCAGGAWTAGALVRGSGRHCAGRQTTPARAWRELEGGLHCRHALHALRPPLASALSAAKGVRPSASPPSPPGECQGVGPARRLARPTRLAAPLSPAWQRSADEASRWVAMPALRGCQPLLGIMGALPPNPRAPQSLAGRRRWGGVRTPLRRGPRQARCAGLPRVAG